MRRLLAALAALLIAAPALAADNWLVIRAPFNGSEFVSQQQWAVVKGVLDTYAGAENWTDVSLSSVTLSGLKAGQVTFGNTTRTFKGVLFIGCDNNKSSFWNQFTLAANWPSVPMGFIGAPYAGANGWNQSASCSTGVSGYANTYGSICAGCPQYSVHMIGTTYKWKVPQLSLFPLRPASAPPGIFRVVAVMGVTSANRRLSAASTTYNYLASEPDSMNMAMSDSAVVWERLRGVGDPAPLWFAASTAGGGQDPQTLKMVIAGMDSATRTVANPLGTLLPANEGRLPQRRAVVVNKALGSGDWKNMNGSTAGSGEGGGAYCYADTCDTTFIKAAVRDSMKALGIKWSAMVDPDSLSARANQLAWLLAVPNCHLLLESFAGANTGTGATGANASASRIMDPMGHLRARNVLPAGTSCASDTCLQCQVTNAVRLLEAAAPGRVDHAIFPAFTDYSPASDSRTSWPKTADSVNTALARAGIRAVLFNPLAHEGNVGRGWSANGGALTGGTSPNGFIASAEYRRVSASASGSGASIAYVACRFEPPTVNAGYEGGSHTLSDDFESGYLTGIWYAPRATLSPTWLNYWHDLSVRTRVVVYNLQEFGAGPANTASPSRAGWWQIKWLTQKMNAVNALEIPGKHLDEWDYVENLTP